MGLVLCEIKILDGNETIKHIAVWNNTSDKVEKGHPMFDTRKTGDLYLNLISKRPSFQDKLGKTYDSITEEGLKNYIINSVIDGED